MPEPRRITGEELSQAVQIAGKEMPDGELRYRLSHNQSGMPVTVTERPPGRGGWQRAHRHEKDFKESYFIHRGCVVLVTLTEDGTLFVLHNAPACFTVESHLPHTLFVDGGTVFGTAKYGPEEPGKDWTASPELDELVCNLSRGEAIRRAITQGR